jgi:hypothetical protein
VEYGTYKTVHKLRSSHIIRHDTTWHDKISLYGFDTLEFKVAGHRQVKTKTDKDCVAGIGSKGYSACLLTAGRCEGTQIFVVSCRVASRRVVSYNVTRPLSPYLSLSSARHNDLGPRANINILCLIFLIQTSLSCRTTSVLEVSSIKRPRSTFVLNYNSLPTLYRRIITVRLSINRGCGCVSTQKTHSSRRTKPMRNIVYSVFNYFGMADQFFLPPHLLPQRGHNI